jgi:hypothetical protein
LFGSVGGDVEEQRRNPRVGEVCGNLGAHDAGAQDGNRSDHAISLGDRCRSGAIAGNTYELGRGKAWKLLQIASERRSE